MHAHSISVNLVEDQPVSTLSEDHGPAAKALVACLTVLAGLLLVVGVLSAWCLDSIDREYRQVVARTATDLNHMQDIASHSGTALANILELPAAREPARRAEVLQTIARERAANDKVYDNLDRAMIQPELRACFNDVLSRRRNFREAADAFIAAAEAAGTMEIGASRWRALLLAFADYQKACDTLSDRIEENSLKLCSQTGRTVDRFRVLFFGLGILPLGVGFLLILLVLYLIRRTPLETDLG